MDLKDFKLYGLCIERLKHQITLARDSGRMCSEDRIELESYRTADPEDIIDLLELYDLEDRSLEAIMAKLEELSGDVTLFIKESIEFGFNEDNELCLYLIPQADEKTTCLETPSSAFAEALAGTKTDSSRSY